MSEEEQKLSWRTETRKVSELKEHPRNPRKITPDQLTKLKESFEKFNYVEMVVIDQNNQIIAGHMRVKTLKALKRGKEEIEVRVPSRPLSSEEADEYLIRSNKNTGEWDWDKLSDEWDAEKLFDWGFTEDELKIKKIAGEAVDDGYDEDPPEEPKTKYGDLYELGPHRLLCGSATSHDDILKLCEDESIDLVLTDPPYNVAYTGGTSEKLTIKNDNMSAEDFAALLRDFYVNAYLAMKPGAGIYVFHADSEGEKFRKYFRESGLKMTQCLIWLKNSLVLGRQDYQWQHEPCLFAQRSGTRR